MKNFQKAFDEAQFELKKVQEEVERLRIERLRAVEDVSVALQQQNLSKQYVYLKCFHFIFNSSYSSTEAKASDYGELSFWESRYVQNESEFERKPRSDLYEWYLDYADFKDLLARDIMSLDTLKSSVILVAGCGNSELCEDLYRDGEYTYVSTSFYIHSDVYS